MTRAAAIVVLVAASLAAQKPARAPDPSDAFFNKAPVPRLEIILEAAAAEKLRADGRTYVRATLREDDKTVYPDVAVKLKGAAGSWRELDDRPAFTLNVDKFVKAQRFHALEKFHLNNSVQDESYLNELLGSQIFRAAGIPSPRVTHARVRLGGRDLGIYVLKEGFDAAFLARWYGSDAGALFDGGFCQDVDVDLEQDAGDEDDKSGLHRLRDACRERDPAKRWPRIAEALDVEDFITFVALELMTGHWDGYALTHNNYRLYFDPEKKRGQFLPHGMDQLFIDPAATILEPPGSIVASQVLLNPTWRARYRKRIRELLPLFDADGLERKVDEAMKRLGPAVAALGPEAAAAHAARVRELKGRLAERSKRLKEQSDEPDPKPLAFPGGSLQFKDWYASSECDDAALSVDKDAGDRFYVIAAGKSGTCVASWRKRVMLSKGRYRLQASVRLQDAAPLADGSPSGACVRTSVTEGAKRIAEARSSQPLACEFEIVEAVQFVELIAEYRGSRGRARFDAASLKLSRVGG